MATPLTLQQILFRLRDQFSNREIVSREEQGIFRYDYGSLYRRSVRLSQALKKLGLKQGECVGTFAWNHHRHLEAYFAVPCMGAILHTINIRLFPDQMVHIINHAEDQILLVDEDLAPLLAPLADKFKTVQAYVIMGPNPDLSRIPLQPNYSYEELLAAAPEQELWPTDLKEEAIAGLCYTTATTGNPKGVPYRHRGVTLQSFALPQRDLLNISYNDATMPIVPMFHANAWGLPMASALVGSKQVFPGPHPDPRIITQLIQDEGVTLAAGVPTVWMGMLAVLEKEKFDLSQLKQIFCGGSAAPPSLIEKFEQVIGGEFVHAYGMTETYPLATMCRLRGELQRLPREQRYLYKAKQGTLVPGLEMRVLNDEGQPVAWDGKSMGELLLRGLWVTEEYYRDPEQTAERIQDGWLKTGDVVTVDSLGYLQIQDRKKDLIKSGGEWISSIDLENTLMAHPAVAEAAVIGVSHPKWTERPLACVVLRPDQPAEKEDLVKFLTDRVAKWWVPDEFVFLSELPKTSVGKFNKKALREKYAKK